MVVRNFTYRVEIVDGPPARHDAQRLARLGPHPGFGSCHVAGRDDKHGQILAGPEDGNGDGRNSVTQGTQVIVKVSITAAYSRAALPRRRAGRIHPRHRPSRWLRDSLLL